MIANHGNGRATETRSVTPPVVIATAGRGAVNHYLNDSPFLEAVEARHDNDLPLICPCHAELYPCVDCRKDMDERATLRRLRLLREAEDSATDGEPRDGQEGYQHEG